MRRALTVGIFAVFILSLLGFSLAIAWWQQRDDRRSQYQSFRHQQPETATIQVGNTSLVVEFARTPEAWERGLMGRDVLAPDAGMLFVFPRAEPRVFWMKETRIPLDLIWIREGRIVGITQHAQPEPGVPDHELRRYASPGPADHVLEVNAGWAEQYQIQVGDRVVDS